MAGQRAPKQWCLTKNETVNSFENWKQNIIYTLSLDSNFAPFLIDGVTWGKKSKKSPLRGFTDDGEAIAADKRRTAQQKVNILELMLGQIANFCPIISRNTIVKNSTSVESIWQAIRLHFGYQSTGAHFIDFTDIRLNPDERPEDLYQRLMAFIEDNLLQADGLSHHDEKLTEDEELTPSLENFVVLTWLRLIHPELPKVVKQRYGTELRSRTLATIKPEISQALSSLLDEINATESAKIMRTAASHFQKPFSPRPLTTKQRQAKRCPLCTQVGRTKTDHFLSECEHLPERDRRFIAKARQIVGIIDDDLQTGCETRDDDDADGSEESSTLRIQVRMSPYIDTFYRHHQARITIDSGATGNMIRHSTAKMFGAEIKTTSQSAHQADGSSPLTVVGETKLTFVRNEHNFVFEGLVVKNLDVDILAGTPFMELNDISVRPAKRQVLLCDGTIILYGSSNVASKNHTIARALVIRAPPERTTVWPGEYVEVDIPTELATDCEYALEPKVDSEAWPSREVVPGIAGKIRIPNASNEPRVLNRNEHFCQIRPVFVPSTSESANEPIQTPPPKKQGQRHSTNVKLDPDNILQPEMKSKFEQVLEEFASLIQTSRVIMVLLALLSLKSIWDQCFPLKEKAAYHNMPATNWSNCKKSLMSSNTKVYFKNLKTPVLLSST